MKEYIAQRLILEEGTDVSRGGRKPELTELNTKENHVGGIAVSPSGITVVITDLALHVEDKMTVPRDAVAGKDAGPTIAATVKDIIKRTKLEPSAVRGIGIATGLSKDQALQQHLGKALGIETTAETDALCAAFGEAALNKNAACGTLLYIHSDRGAAVVIKESVLLGESRYLEPWPETLGMVDAARREAARGIGTTIVDLAKGKLENITEEIVITAALGKDEVAHDIVRSVGVNLGVRVAYLINLFDPDAVVLGGGLERAPDIILQAIRKTVKRFALNDRSDSITVLHGVLGDDATAVGAAGLAARQVFLKA